MPHLLISLPDELRINIREAPCPVLSLERPCWLWEGCITHQGYGILYRYTRGEHTKGVLIHPLVYNILVGPRIEGLTFDHLCRVRRCCQPDHLEQVTKKVNTLRGEGPSAKNVGKQMCKYGHALEGNNLVVWEGMRRGKPSIERNCRACMTERSRKFREYSIGEIKNGRFIMRSWRVSANFHKVGDLVVLVQSPNWVGGLRKGALAIKSLPELKGRRLKAGSFTIIEVEAPVLAEVMASEQLPLPGQGEGEGGQTPPSKVG